MSKTHLNNRSSLTTLFKSCLDILRSDIEHLIGDNALRTLGYLLILRNIENKKTGTMKINFNKSYPGLKKEERDKLVPYTRFSQLVQQKEDNLPKIIKTLWEKILSEHSETKDIFVKNDSLNIKSQSTYKILIKKLYQFDFENIEHDIQGECYEDVAQDILVGKTLGQFFTPPKVKQLIVNLVKPILKSNGTFENIFDPAMGTGGFLITSLRYLQKQSKQKNIPIDWNFAKNHHGIGGRELHRDTYRLASVNMLVSSGYIFNKTLERGDSIRYPIKEKYNIVMTNPPYGLKINYDEISNPLKNDYLPIKSNNSTPLFIQAIIYMLKINGRAAVVIPNGQELFSTNKTYVATREFLLKTCDLKAIIYLPSGIFTNTSIKTCILYFVKRKQGTDVLNVQRKISNKTHKEIARKYIFCKECVTTKVKFAEWDGKYKTLVNVPIEKIVKNNYSLNYAEYIEVEEVKYDKSITVKTLGEVCELNNGKNITKKDLCHGSYPVVGGGKSPLGYHNIYNIPKKTIIISKDGAYAGYVSRYDSKVFVSNHGIYITSDNKNISYDFMYYYLKYIQKKLYGLQTGTAQPGVKKEHINNLKIPIPSLEVQKDVVANLDFIYDECIKTSEKQILQLQKLNKLCIDNQVKYGKNNIKTLGEVCKLNGNGKTNTKDITNTGEYPFYKASYNNPSGTHMSYDFDGNQYLLIIKSGGSASKPISRNYGIGKVFLVNGKCAANIAVFQLLQTSNDDIKFLYYYLDFIHPTIQGLANYSTNNGNINMKKLMKLKIPIPSLEVQKSIVQYCDHNYQLITTLKQKIVRNKQLANDILNNVIKSE